MFISSGRTMTSNRSNRRKVRACILASIFPVRPFTQSAARSLLLKLLITPAMSANCLRMSTLSLQAASVGAVQSRIENRPLFSRYFSGLELIGVNGMHATVEVALREFIQENGGGPGVRLRKRHQKKS